MISEKFIIESHRLKVDDTVRFSLVMKQTPSLSASFFAIRDKNPLPVGKSHVLISHMTKSINPDELLTVTQAAAERGTTRQAINYLIRQGKLEAVEIAGKRFISRQTLASFIPDLGGRPPKIEKSNATYKKRGKEG
jgi:hypothetical protein